MSNQIKAGSLTQLLDEWSGTAEKKKNWKMQSKWQLAIEELKLLEGTIGKES